MGEQAGCDRGGENDARSHTRQLSSRGSNDLTREECSECTSVESDDVMSCRLRDTLETAPQWRVARSFGQCNPELRCVKTTAVDARRLFGVSDTAAGGRPSSMSLFGNDASIFPVAPSAAHASAATAGFVITPPRVFSKNDVADMEYVDTMRLINDSVMA